MYAYHRTKERKKPSANVATVEIPVHAWVLRVLVGNYKQMWAVSTADPVH